jgi:rubrerythrin
MPPSVQNATFEQPKTYCEGLRNALKGEQNAVQKYRKILFVLTDRTDINTLTEIITDELRHGILYSYLYSKNGCSV